MREFTSFLEDEENMDLMLDEDTDEEEMDYGQNDYKEEDVADDSMEDDIGDIGEEEEKEEL